MVGGIQSELVKLFYNARGDDGLLDRVLLVGDGIARVAQWPKDADDPVLNSAWSKAMERLLRIEAYAEDAINQQIESRFTPEAVEVCKGLLARLNNLVVVLALPVSQRGIVKKLIQHAVKFALLHRCLRWAAGEFGDRGPLGDVDADDAIAAREATMFFLGRWLIWRKELRGGAGEPTGAVGLSRAAGNDSVLQSLAGVAAGAQRTVTVIERLVRLLRPRGSQPIVLATLSAVQALTDISPDEMRHACHWLVNNGHAVWLDPNCWTFRLVAPAPPVERGCGELVVAGKGSAT